MSVREELETLFDKRNNLDEEGKDIVGIMLEIDEIEDKILDIVINDTEGALKVFKDAKDGGNEYIISEMVWPLVMCDKSEIDAFLLETFSGKEEMEDIMEAIKDREESKS